MAICVTELGGVTAEIAAALQAIGIHNSADLLAATGQSQERADIAAALGIEVDTLLDLTNRADLMRIQGMTQVYTDLLRMAGVDSVTELRRRIAENLYVRLVTIASQHPYQRSPRLDEVQRWVTAAKQLERAVYY